MQGAHFSAVVLLFNNAAAASTTIAEVSSLSSCDYDPISSPQKKVQCCIKRKQKSECDTERHPCWSVTSVVWGCISARGCARHEWWVLQDIVWTEGFPYFRKIQPHYTHVSTAPWCLFWGDVISVWGNVTFHADTESGLAKTVHNHISRT